jgi:hypothetical protein
MPEPSIDEDKALASCPFAYSLLHHSFLSSLIVLTFLLPFRASIFFIFLSLLLLNRCMSIASLDSRIIKLRRSLDFKCRCEPCHYGLAPLSVSFIIRSHQEEGMGAELCVHMLIRSHIQALEKGCNKMLLLISDMPFSLFLSLSLSLSPFILSLINFYEHSIAAITGGDERRGKSDAMQAKCHTSATH